MNLGDGWQGERLCRRVWTAAEERGKAAHLLVAPDRLAVLHREAELAANGDRRDSYARRRNRGRNAEEDLAQPELAVPAQPS